MEQYQYEISRLNEENIALRTQNDDLKEHSAKLENKMQHMEKVQRVNCALAIHYMNHGRMDYFDEMGKGKFIAFVEAHKFKPENLIKIDDNFPLNNVYDNDEQVNNEIFNIVQYCVKNGVPPKDIIWEVTDCKSVNDCQQTKKIIKALKYFSTISDFEKDETKDNFVKYCQEIYPEMLNDHIHILTVHNSYGDLDIIYKSLLEEYEFSECNVENCLLSLRYYNNDRAKNVRHEEYELYEEQELAENHELKEESNNFIFYRDIMDQIHCYLFHMCDIGMRIHRDDVKENNDPFEEGYIDNKFKEIRDTVKAKIKKIKDISGINTYSIKSKFTIKTLEIQTTAKDTFMDGLFQLIGSIKNHNYRKILHDLLLNEEYDSDALNADVLITDFQHSNIYKLSTYEPYKIIKQLSYDSKLFRYTFNIGYRFYYWHYYRHKHDIEDQNEWWNINDHSGYKIAELFIDSKYKDIKEEILNNKIYPLKQYQLKISINKMHRYAATKKAKSTEAFEDEFGDRNQYLRYNIHKGQVISDNHLLSVIIYCDWSTLSSYFSATFRKTSSYDSLSVVKQKNAEFANWSRLLRETVEMFGKSPQSLNKLNGPFYSGMSPAMVVPEFSIRLSAPTSTSTVLEVGTGFAGDDGIVVQLNNAEDDLSAFSCCWLSNYASEKEVLFCGGFERIQIESVCMMATSENFQQFFRALFVFDKMISSNYIFNKLDAPMITDEDTELLKGLIKQKLEDVKGKNRYPRYICNTFDAFINHKSQIVVNLYNIHNYFSKISDLIMQPATSNLFKPILLKLFKNIKTIIIQTTEQTHENPFNLLELLSLLDESCLTSNTFIIIKAIHQESKYCWQFDVDHNGGSWILDVFSPAIVKQYESKKFNIKFYQKDNIGNVDAKDDCLEIVKC
eukprot:321814_1